MTNTISSYVSTYVTNIFIQNTKLKITIIKPSDTPLNKQPEEIQTNIYAHIYIFVINNQTN